MHASQSLIDTLAFGLPALLVLGVLCQWMAWRFRAPSILVYLSVGLLIGPVCDFFRPAEIFDQLTLPLVSLSAAVVLFEGGMSVSWNELRSVSSTVRRLVTVGLIVTWVGIAAVAFLGLGWSADASLLLGAVLVVTGPTVITPLLREVRIRESLASVLRLEGTFNDPIGALLAIVVFQAIQVKYLDAAFGEAALQLATGVLLGFGAGFAAAWMIVALIKRGFIPKHMQNAAILACMLGTYAVCQSLRHESGLLAATIMGMTLSSQKKVSTKSSFHFFEHARVILIPFLFLVLTARIPRETFASFSWTWIAFALVAVLVVRPLAVLLSTWRSNAPLRERVFLAAISPRGIVAAAIASVFGTRMIEEGYAEGGHFVPLVFLTILSTGLVTGLVARPLRNLLGLQEEGRNQSDRCPEPETTSLPDGRSG